MVAQKLLSTAHGDGPGDVRDAMEEDDNDNGVFSMDAAADVLADEFSEQLNTHELSNVLPPDVFVAAHNGDCQAVRAFLADPRGDVNMRDSLMRGTLLMAAVATQQLELIELLLSAGASVHVTDAFGSTVISAASCPLDHQPIRCKLAQGVKPTASRRAVLQRLMAAGADPNVQDRLGLSALMVAAISGEAECVRVLMQGGARTDLLEDHGYTALALAQLHGQHLVVKLLKQPPARARESGRGGRKARLLGRQSSSSGRSRSSSRSIAFAAAPLPAHAKAEADADVAAQIDAYQRYQRSSLPPYQRTMEALFGRAGAGAGGGFGLDAAMSATVHGGMAFLGLSICDDDARLKADRFKAAQLSVPWTVHDGRFFAHHVLRAGRRGLRFR